MVWRELALEISLTSLGSSQILRLPQPTTDAASRFWVRRLTLDGSRFISIGKDEMDWMWGVSFVSVRQGCNELAWQQL